MIAKWNTWRFDLKTERIVINHEQCSIRFVPSREDSLDRLYEEGRQFRSEERVADLIVQRLMLEKLRKCLHTLSSSKIDLIYALFFESKSERQLSSETGIPQKTINDSKRRILRKLKKMIEK